MPADAVGRRADELGVPLRKLGEDEAPASSGSRSGLLSSVNGLGRRTASAVNTKPASNVAGFLLAAIVWGWIVLPFIRGGPGAVRDVWRAKFFNKGADGKALP